MALIATLISPEEIASVDHVSPPIAQRFPVPQSAMGFCIDVDFEMVLNGLDPRGIIVGAVYPESVYLEPTIGQIWPRIG